MKISKKRLMSSIMAIVMVMCMFTATSFAKTITVLEGFTPQTALTISGHQYIASAIYEAENDKYLYVTYRNGNNGGIHVYNISNPATPVQVTTTDAFLSATGQNVDSWCPILVSGGYLYYGVDSAIRKFDVKTNPAQPAYVATYTTSNSTGHTNAATATTDVTHINIHDGKLYASFINNTLIYYWDNSYQTVNTEETIIDAPVNLYANVQASKIMFLSDSAQNICGIKTAPINTTESEIFAQSASNRTTEKYLGMETDDRGYAYVAEEGKLYVVDASNWNNFKNSVYTATLECDELGKYHKNMVAKGNYLYVTEIAHSTYASEFSKLLVFDISEPASPFLAAKIADVGCATSHISSDNDGNIYVVSKTNPAKLVPVTISIKKEETADTRLKSLVPQNAITVSGHQYIASAVYESDSSKYLYVTYRNGNNGGIHVYNISNPATPVQVTTTDAFLSATGQNIDSWCPIAVSDGYLYYGVDSVIRKFDIKTNPAQPVYIATYTTSNSTGHTNAATATTDVTHINVHDGKLYASFMVNTLIYYWDNSYQTVNTEETIIDAPVNLYANVQASKIMFLSDSAQNICGIKTAPINTTESEIFAQSASNRTTEKYLGMETDDRGYAYIAEEGKLYVVDASNWNNFKNSVYTATLECDELGKYHKNMVAKGNYLYVTEIAHSTYASEFSKLLVFDISEPASPFLAAKIADVGCAMSHISADADGNIYVTSKTNPAKLIPIVMSGLLVEVTDAEGNAVTTVEKGELTASVSIFNGKSGDKLCMYMAMIDATTGVVDYVQVKTFVLTDGANIISDSIDMRELSHYNAYTKMLKIFLWDSNLTPLCNPKEISSLSVEGSDFDCYIAPETELVKGIVLVQRHGMGETLKNQTAFKEFCAERDIAIVSFIDDEGKLKDFPDSEIEQCAQTILTQLDNFAVSTGHDELRYAPIATFGHSNASQFAAKFAAYIPERCFAAVTFKSAYGTQFNHNALIEGNVPLLVVTGEEDEDWGFNGQIEAAEEMVKNGGLVTYAQDMDAGHYMNDYKANTLTFEFINRAFELKVPEISEYNGKSPTLNTISQQDGYFGHGTYSVDSDGKYTYTMPEYLSAQKYSEKQAEDSNYVAQAWLFDEDFAAKWKEFNETGFIENLGYDYKY